MTKLEGGMIAGVTLALALATLVGASKTGQAGSAEAAMKKSDCFTCHQVEGKLTGPAFKDIAKKYKGDPKAPAMLVQKIKAGGSGNWGTVPMAAHPGLKDQQVQAMVQWILAR